MYTHKEMSKQVLEEKTLTIRFKLQDKVKKDRQKEFVVASLEGDIARTKYLRFKNISILAYNQKGGSFRAISRDYSMSSSSILDRVKW